MALIEPAQYTGKRPKPVKAAPRPAPTIPNVVRQLPPVTSSTTLPVDYQALLANDPTLQAALLQVNDTGLLNRANLTGQQQQVFGRLGEAPDLASLPAKLQGLLAGAVTPELQGIIGAANQFGVSQLARLQHDYAGGQAENAAHYAARGGHSGGFGVHANENLRNLTLGQYDARQNALDTLGQLQGSYLSGQQTLTGQAATATADANKRISDMIGQGLIAPRTVTTTGQPTFSNPAAPRAPYTPVTTQAGPSYEPRPTGEGYRAISQPPPKPKPIAAPHFTLARTRVF